MWKYDFYKCCLYHQHGYDLIQYIDFSDRVCVWSESAWKSCCKYKSSDVYRSASADVSTHSSGETAVIYECATNFSV